MFAAGAIGIRDAHEVWSGAIRPNVSRGFRHAATVSAEVNIDQLAMVFQNLPSGFLHGARYCRGHIVFRFRGRVKNLTMGQRAEIESLAPVPSAPPERPRSSHHGH